MIWSSSDLSKVAISKLIELIRAEASPASHIYPNYICSKEMQRKYENTDIERNFHSSLSLTDVRPQIMFGKCDILETGWGRLTGAIH